MATTINADTSSGLILTSDTSGIVQIQNAGTTKLTVNSSGATVAGTLAATAVTGDGSALTNLPSAGLNDYSTFVNSTEKVTTIAACPTSAFNYDTNTQSIIYSSVANCNNWTVNFRASSGETFASKLAVGESATFVHITSNTGTAYYPAAPTVDGSATNTTRRWQGGSAPTAGNVSSFDVYTYNITKTATGSPDSYLIFISQTNFG
jgi:hypothetical protein